MTIPFKMAVLVPFSVLKHEVPFHEQREKIFKIQALIVDIQTPKYIRIYSNVTTMKSLELFSRNLRSKDFFLKIGILSVKVYTKRTPTMKYLT